jgi:hypothetical protein
VAINPKPLKNLKKTTRGVNSMKYEYQAVKFFGDDLTNINASLNEHADAGWRVVGIGPSTIQAIVVVFERAKTAAETKAA